MRHGRTLEEAAQQLDDAEGIQRRRGVAEGVADDRRHLLFQVLDRLLELDGHRLELVVVRIHAVAKLAAHNGRFDVAKLGANILHLGRQTSPAHGAQFDSAESRKFLNQLEDFDDSHEPLFEDGNFFKDDLRRRIPQLLGFRPTQRQGAASGLPEPLRQALNILALFVVELAEVSENGAGGRRLLHGFFDFPGENRARVEEDAAAFDQSVADLAEQVGQFDGLIDNDQIGILM